MAQESSRLSLNPSHHFPSCVALDKWLTLSELLFPFLSSGGNDSAYLLELFLRGFSGLLEVTHLAGPIHGLEPHCQGTGFFQAFLGH